MQKKLRIALFVLGVGLIGGIVLPSLNWNLSMNAIVMAPQGEAPVPTLATNTPPPRSGSGGQRVAKPVETVLTPRETPPTATLRPTETALALATATPTEEVLPTETATPSATSQPTLSPDEWQTWPVMPSVSAAMREQYQRAVAQGAIDPYAFSVFGDCQSEAEAFLGVFDTSPVLVSRMAEEFQETIEHFGGSFYRYNPASKSGSTTASLLFPPWNDKRGGAV